MKCTNALFAYQWKSVRKMMLPAVLIAGGIVVYPLEAQSPGTPGQIAPATKPTVTNSAAQTASITAGAKVPFRPSMPRREVEYFDGVWGIDSLSVKAVESGELIRFTWRVADETKAKVLNDEKIEPYLLDPAANAKLVVPELPFMGKMRVKNTPVAGMTCWMAFSNPGKVVKPGDHVIIVVGQFRADGLVVQ